MRTFAAATLNAPFTADGRTALLEPRGSRTLEPVDELSLRLASTLPFGRTRPLEIYADIYNVLGGETVTAVETGSPIGTSSGVPLVFETPIDVQRPFRVVVGRPVDVLGDRRAPGAPARRLRLIRTRAGPRRRRGGSSRSDRRRRGRCGRRALRRAPSRSGGTACTLRRDTVRLGSEKLCRDASFASRQCGHRAGSNGHCAAHRPQTSRRSPPLHAANSASPPQTRQVARCHSPAASRGSNAAAARVRYGRRPKVHTCAAPASAVASRSNQRRSSIGSAWASRRHASARASTSGSRKSARRSRSAAWPHSRRTSLQSSTMIVELEHARAGGEPRGADGVGADRPRQRHARVDAALGLQPGELEIDGGSEIGVRRPQPAKGGDVTRLGGGRAGRRRRHDHAERRPPRALIILRDAACVTRAAAAARPASPRHSPRTAGCASARSSS